jgi:nucleotide-binding universal stress UspA family protein
MFKSILIATDGSPLAEKAVENGLALAKAVSAKATALVVEPMFPHYIADTGFNKSVEFDSMVKLQTRATFEKVAERARTLGVACETTTAANDQVHEAIVDTATSLGCDLIVMASHGRSGMTAVVLGSQTQKVLTHSKIPVLVYR